MLVYMCSKIIFNKEYKNYLIPHKIPVPVFQKVEVEILSCISLKGFWVTGIRDVMTLHCHACMSWIRVWRPGANPSKMDSG